MASKSSSMGLQALSSLGFSRAALDWPRTTGVVSPGKPYFLSSSRTLELDEVEELGVVDEVDLVEEDDDVGHTDLAGQQDVLAGLGHGAVGGGHDQDRAVHLGGAGDHVLDEVGVARAVDVGVVALLGLVLGVRRRDRHGLVGVADGAALGDVGVGLALRRRSGPPSGPRGRR
jgi:hypothetical protein